jgi:hypothetical protein
MRRNFKTDISCPSYIWENEGKRQVPRISFVQKRCFSIAA